MQSPPFEMLWDLAKRVATYLVLDNPHPPSRYDPLQKWKISPLFQISLIEEKKQEKEYTRLFGNAKTVIGNNIR